MVFVGEEETRHHHTTPHHTRSPPWDLLPAATPIHNSNSNSSSGAHYWGEKARAFCGRNRCNRHRAIGWHFRRTTLSGTFTAKSIRQSRVTKSGTYHPQESCNFDEAAARRLNCFVCGRTPKTHPDCVVTVHEVLWTGLWPPPATKIYAQLFSIVCPLLARATNLQV